MRSKFALDPLPLLEGFAAMAKNSTTFDDDWQGDGWGVAWRTQAGTWEIHTALDPVWECREVFPRIPRTTHLAIHARSASFAHHKGILQYNQPFIAHTGIPALPTVFVFNGLMRSVRLPSNLDGEIGAQKLWSLLQRFLRSYPPDQALNKIAVVLRKAAEVQAANIGLIQSGSLYALNLYSCSPEYYALHVHKTSELSIIASEPIGNYPFIMLKPMPSGGITQHVVVV